VLRKSKKSRIETILAQVEVEEEVIWRHLALSKVLQIILLPHKEEEDNLGNAHNVKCKTKGVLKSATHASHQNPILVDQQLTDIWYR
jgi:hypothetical protein